jgi:hypothetical protein
MVCASCIRLKKTTQKAVYILTKQQTKWRSIPESTYADTYIEEDGDLTFDSQAK